MFGDEWRICKQAYERKVKECDFRDINDTKKKEKKKKDVLLFRRTIV